MVNIIVNSTLYFKASFDPSYLLHIVSFPNFQVSSSSFLPYTRTPDIPYLESSFDSYPPYIFF